MSRIHSKPRGRCNRCGHVRTLASLARGYCKPCGYVWDNCIRCQAYRKIYVQGRCYLCYQDDLIRARLNHIESDFVRPASKYNQFLFELYLTYLRRYRMSYDHLKPTLGLIKYLKTTPVQPVLRWNQIYQLSERHPLTRSPGKDVHDNGCAWMKIGYMLQEMGVLGSRADEHEHRNYALLEDLDPNSAIHVIAFAKCLKQSGRADASVTRAIAALRSLSHWLSQLDPPETLIIASQPSIECYLDLMRTTRTYANTTVTFRRISAFYRFAKRNRLILLDPTQNIRLSRAAEKLVVCSKTQFDQICAFVRSPNSDPVRSMALALILFYGLTTADLAGATLKISQAAQLKIILTRRPRSRGRRFYNREQIISLPSDPPWIGNLVERFCANWRAHFTQIQPKASFPRTPLFLDPKSRHNRNISDTTVCNLVKAATLQATGIAIPPRVLRQSCGHLMTRGQDASALSHLGWSPQFAFHYTWLPRVQF